MDPVNGELAGFGYDSSDRFCAGFTEEQLTAALSAEIASGDTMTVCRTHEEEDASKDARILLLMRRRLLAAQAAPSPAPHCNPWGGGCTHGTMEEQELRVQDDQCGACDPGFELLDDYSCSACPRGEFGSDSNCDACSAGQFAANLGMSACVTCAEGRISEQDGADACDTCERDGMIPNEAQTLCEQCPAGSVGVIGDSVCTDCTPGHVAVEDGLAACDDCARGKIQPGPAQTACTDCAAGTVQPLWAATDCTDCEPGMFIGVAGATACQQCGDGEVAGAAAATVCDVCEAGKRASYGEEAEAAVALSAADGAWTVRNANGSSCACTASSNVGSPNDYVGGLQKYGNISLENCKELCEGHEICRGVRHSGTQCRMLFDGTAAGQGRQTLAGWSHYDTANWSEPEDWGCPSWTGSYTCHSFGGGGSVTW